MINVSNEFLSHFVKPVRGAFQEEGILSPEDLANYSEKEILALHGVGPKSLPVMKQVLSENGLKFKETD
jgi:DNA-directed RNA polymerase alpha subunit